MIEKILERLAAAIEDNTAALREQGAALDEIMVEKPAAPKKKRATKKKETTPDAKPKTVAGTSDNAAKTEPAATTSVEPAAEKTEVVKESLVNADPAKVQTHLRAIASQLTDTNKLFALIQKHGGQQFSDLKPECYDELIAEAEALVEAGE